MIKKRLLGLVLLSVLIISVCLHLCLPFNGKHISRTIEIKSRRLPNYIIIGVKKCGTRALLEYIRRHPKVAAATEEIHFFDDPVKYKKLGLNWYRKQMPESYVDQITIEKSPSYYIYPNASDRIYAMSKNTRIIIVVREPITRLLSEYLHSCRNILAKNLKCRTFNDVITTRNGSVNFNSDLVVKSRYFDFIDEWIDKFSLNQIHVVDGETLVTDPYSEVVLVEKFLSLNKYFTRDHFVYNSDKGFYCFKTDTISNSSCLGKSKGVQHPPIDERIINMFRKYYKPYNEAFFKKVNRTFNWKMALERINTN